MSPSEPPRPGTGIASQGRQHHRDAAKVGRPGTTPSDDGHTERRRGLTRKHWDETLAEYGAWAEDHDALPSTGGGAKERKLARWASDQRTRARKGALPGSQYARLAAVIGDPTTRPVLYEPRQELAVWVTAHGRLPVLRKDQDQRTENAYWHRLYRLQRALKGGTARLHQVELLLAVPGALEGPARAEAEALATKLRAADQARLAEIRTLQGQGTLEQERWEASFAALQQWVLRSGALPRRRTDDPAEYRVANWLNIQRTHARKGTLDAARDARLRTVAGALEPRNGRAPEDRLADLKAFMDANGRPPAAISTDPAETSLWTFMNKALTGRAGGATADSIQAEARQLRSRYPSRNGQAVGDVVERFEHYTASHRHLPPDSKKNRPPLNRRSLERALTSASTTESLKSRIRSLLELPAFRERHQACPFGVQCRQSG